MAMTRNEPHVQSGRLSLDRTSVGDRGVHRFLVMYTVVPATRGHVTLPVRSQIVPSWQVVPRGRDRNFDTNIYGRGGHPFQSEGQMRLPGAARAPE